MRTVAALYVATGGCYYAPGLDCDPWDEARDAPTMPLAKKHGRGRG